MENKSNNFKTYNKPQKNIDFHIKIRNEEGKMIKIFDWSKVNTVKHFKLKTTQITLDCTKHPPPILEGDIKFVYLKFFVHSVYNVDVF